MERVDKDKYYLEIAKVISKRASCARRAVGCVLIDYIGHILSTGYNGPPAGFIHCTDTPCAGAASESGKDLDLCEAIHAEQNALLQCTNVNNIYTIYTTTFPCIHCTKLLLNTSCKRIVYADTYPHQLDAMRMWVVKGKGTTVHIKND